MSTEAPLISLALLGAFGLRVDGRYCPPLPRKAQALIALLALQPDQAMPREVAVRMIWGDDVAGEGCISPRHALTVIRQRVGVPLVRLARGMLILRRDGVAIDVTQFGAIAGSPDCRELARCAALYRGELLENVATVSPAYDEWLAVERIRFAAIAGEVLRQLALRHAEAGEFDAAVATARRVVALDELREDGHQLLISILDRSGREGEARRHSGVCRRLLTPTPAPALRSLPATAPVPIAGPEPASVPSRRVRWWVGGAAAICFLGAFTAGAADRAGHRTAAPAAAAVPAALW